MTMLTASAIVLLVFQGLIIVALVIERFRRHQSQKRYALATAAGGVGVWDLNLETNEIDVDPFLKATLGYADHEIKNHLSDWSRLVPPDDVPAVRAHAEELIHGDSSNSEVEHRMLHRDGSVRWFLTRGSVVRRHGRATRIIGTETDITERKKSELALDETQAELSRVSRLTALGEFAASIAHDVRQPLTSIIMSARASLQWLGDAKPDLTEIRAALVDIVDASKHADDLIQRNRELFKEHTVGKEPLDINEIVRQVAGLAGTQLQSGQVTLTTSLAPELPPIIADRIELQQVLLNLILNAIDATEPLDPGTRRIDISTCLVPDDLVQVSVCDNGIGLARVNTQRMFSFWYTTKPNGTGIGLSLSRSIVEAHAGRLWAEQNSGPGATFFFTLPVDSPAVTVAPKQANFLRAV